MIKVGGGRNDLRRMRRRNITTPEWVISVCSARHSGASHEYSALIDSALQQRAAGLKRKSCRVLCDGAPSPSLRGRRRVVTVANAFDISAAVIKKKSARGMKRTADIYGNKKSGGQRSPRARPRRR